MSKEEENEVIAEDLGEQCSKVSKFYQNHFPEIPQMSWDEFYRLQRSQDQPILNKPANSDVDDTQNDIASDSDTAAPSKLAIIDVRSASEYNVSTIPGAVSLATFQKEIVHNLSPDANVVTFCTVGYRSGMEARRLKELYPKLNISHLEGILSYTHSKDSSIQDKDEGKSDNINKVVSSQNNGTEEKKKDPSLPPLIVPETKETTMKIHTFSIPTKIGARDSYEAVYYNSPQLTFHVASVGLRSLYLKVVSFIHSVFK